MSSELYPTSTPTTVSDELSVQVSFLKENATEINIQRNGHIVEINDTNNQIE
jgi:hypothetical protein